jgi:hypothetical protein
MSSKRKPVRYCIRVKGHLRPQGPEWLDQMMIVTRSVGCELYRPVPHGIRQINRVYISRSMTARLVYR